MKKDFVLTFIFGLLSGIVLWSIIVIVIIYTVRWYNRLPVDDMLMVM